jgi:DNA-binding SARP family transcriptional activator
MSRAELEIRLWGPITVLESGAPVDLPPSRKARALLAYLVATGRPHGRSSLCDLLWDDVDDPRAGLRWALSKLRPVVDRTERRRIVTFRDRVEFDADAAAIDLHRVRSEIPDDPSEAPVEALEAALGGFRGDFLEDLELPRCHQWEAWRMGMREDMRKLQLSILVALTGRLRGDPNAALPHAFARLRLEPFSEDAHIVAMELLGDLGRLDQALEVFERCRRTLSRELGTAPSPALGAARRRLRHRAAGGLGVEGSAEEAPKRVAGVLTNFPAPEGLPEPGPEDPPLVGRADEFEVLARIAQGGEGDEPTAALITGEPGIGKTRLLRELVGQVRSKGKWVLGAPVFESEEIRPYGPWIDLIRSLPDGVMDDDVRRNLSALLTAPGPSPPDHGPAARTRIFESVARLLVGLATPRNPGLVVLDDVQWLDASSAALLHYVVRAAGKAPLALALAAREEEIEEGSAPARVLRSLDEGGRLRRIPLRRLDSSETATLVRAVDDAADSSRIFATSEGNPLFALAMAGSLRESLGRASGSVEEELSFRLERLDPEARSLLPWAAALGRAFDVPTLVRVTDRPDPEIVAALDRLERRGILRASGPDRYDFTHSLLRRTAYRRLSEPMRRAVHRSIARTLDDARSREASTASAVAHHAELGGLPALAARSCAEAAEHSLWLFAFDEAAELVSRGLEQLGDLPDETRIPLEMGLLRIYGFRSMRGLRPEDVEARVQRVTGEAVASGLTPVVALGHATLMELQYQRGALAQAARSSVSAADAGREGEPAAAIRALTETATCLLLLDQAPDDARRLASEAFDLAEEHDVEMDVLALARAFLHHHDGELEAACRAFQDVIRLGRKNRDRWWECPALTRMAIVELDRGDPEAALARAREAEALSERLGDEAEAAFARGLGAVARCLGAATGSWGQEAGTLEDRDEPVDGAASGDASGSMPEEEGALRAVDEALEELRNLDSLWAIGQLQAYAAEVELRGGRAGASGERAEEAVGAARTLEQPSLLAVGRSLLARSTALEGSAEAAARQLADYEAPAVPRHLSARARRSLRQARDAVSR